MTPYRATRSILFWAVAAALVLAGCGGGSSESSTTTTTTSTSAGGKNTRLSQAEWNEYKAVGRSVRAVA